MARASYIKESEEKKIFDIIHMGKCLGLSYVISVALLFLLSIGATVWNMSSGMVDISITVITGISVMICGLLSARGVGRGGLLNGVLAGVLYTALLYAIGGIITGSLGFNAATITAFLIGIICGGIGGVIGVNTKKRRR